MAGYFKFEEIENILTKNQNETGLKSHDTGNVKFLFPFTSSKVTKVFNEDLTEIVGELVRLTNNFEEPSFDYEGDYIYSNSPLVNKVVSQVDFETDENHEETLAGFLEDFLMNRSSNLKPLHLYLFNYIGLNGQEVDKQKYARFIYDILFHNRKEISSLFSSKETNNLMTELIITSLPDLKSKTKSKSVTNTKYSKLNNKIETLVVEDLLYLSEYNEYFINHFFAIIHYYVFQYVLQFLKNAQRFGTHREALGIDPFHFTLEWETGVGSYRNAIKDYQFIKNNAQNLFVHIHCLSHLNHTYLSPEQEKREIKTYQELINDLSTYSNETQAAEKQKLVDWILRYSELAQVEIQGELSERMTFSQLFKSLFDQLKEGMSEEVCKRYGKNIDNIGKSQFLRARGKHGFVPTLKQDHLLMLSAVAVKDQMIPLKDYFVELEKRGIVFDQYSKKEVVKLLDHLNYIEKKSDSGDAQYVKPIL